MDSQHKNEKAEPNAALTSGRDEKVPAELTSQDLLSAIDFEISQRQDSVTRYGITVWGTVGTIVALLWTAIISLTNEPHEWPRLLLVSLAASYILDGLAAVFLKSG